MAHYDRKLKITDFEMMQALCKAHAVELYVDCEETDDYFANFALGQYYKLRQYNPPIKIASNPETGEMWHSSAKDILYKTHTGNLVLSHRLIISPDSTKNADKRERIVVFTAESAAQAKEAAEIMKQGNPVDSHIVKQRSAYSMEMESYPVIIHLDRSVKNEEGYDLGRFIEFEIKVAPDHIIPEKDQDRLFEKLYTTFGLEASQEVSESYRDLMHRHAADYGPLVKTLPEAVLKEIRSLEEFHYNKGDLIIRDFDTQDLSAYFITEGETRVFYENSQEDIRRIGQYDFFGEMASRSPRKQRNGNVQAMTDLSVKRIPEELLHTLYQDSTIANHLLDRYVVDESKRTGWRQSGMTPR